MIRCPLRWCAIFLPLGLAACHPSESGNYDDGATNQVEAATPATDTMNVAEPSPAPAVDDLPVGIPDAIRGRWGMVPADCTSQLGDAKGLLTVGKDDLHFYESRAKLGKIAEQTPSRIDDDFAFSGEGMTWSRRIVLDAQDGGRRLIRRDYGDDASPEPLRYSRCP